MTSAASGRFDRINPLPFPEFAARYAASGGLAHSPGPEIAPLLMDLRERGLLDAIGQHLRIRRQGAYCGLDVWLVLFLCFTTGSARGISSRTDRRRPLEPCGGRDVTLRFQPGDAHHVVPPAEGATGAVQGAGVIVPGADLDDVFQPRNRGGLFAVGIGGLARPELADVVVAPAVNPARVREKTPVPATENELARPGRRARRLVGVAGPGGRALGRLGTESAHPVAMGGDADPVRRRAEGHPEVGWGAALSQCPDRDEEAADGAVRFEET